MTDPATRASSPVLRWRERAQPILPFVLLLALWWAVTAAEVYPPALLAPPAEVLASVGALIESRELQQHLGLSLQRLGLGLALGVLVGLAFGIAMAVSRTFDRLTAPTFHAVRQVPSVALIPVLILVLGVGEAFKIVIIVKAAFFPVALAAAEGVRGIPAALGEVARAWQLPPRAVLWKVILPCTVPQVITGIRLAAGRAWGTLVAAELIASEAGLGQMMEFARQMFRMEVVLLGLVLTGVIGFLLDRALKAVEARFTRWRVAS